MPFPYFVTFPMKRILEWIQNQRWSFPITIFIINVADIYKWTITTLYNFSTKQTQLVTYPWCRSCPIIPHTGIIEGEAQITDLELERVDREAEFGALIVRIFRTQCHNTGTSKKFVPVCLYHNKSISSQGVPLSISAGVFNGHFCKKILNIPIKTKEY